MSIGDSLNEIRFDLPEAGWMICHFSSKYNDRAFDISDAVNDPLAMFNDMLEALRHGRVTPVVELFLEPEWILVSYDHGREALTITHKLEGISYSCGVRPDELAYFIHMGLKIGNAARALNADAPAPHTVLRSPRDDDAPGVGTGATIHAADRSHMTPGTRRRAPAPSPVLTPNRIAH